MVEKVTSEAAYAHGGKRDGAGRPTLYTPELIERVLDLMTEDDKNLWVISKMPGMPKYGTFWRWMSEHPEFEQRYYAAERVRGRHALSGIERVEREVRSGKITPAQASVLVNSKRWRAQVLNSSLIPAAKTEVSGPSGGAIEMKSDADMAARVASLVLIGMQRKRADDDADLAA